MASDLPHLLGEGTQTNPSFDIPFYFWRLLNVIAFTATQVFCRVKNIYIAISMPIEPTLSLILFLLLFHLKFNMLWAKYSLIWPLYRVTELNAPAFQNFFNNISAKKFSEQFEKTIVNEVHKGALNWSQGINLTSYTEFFV